MKALININDDVDVLSISMRNGHYNIQHEHKRNGKKKHLNYYDSVCAYEPLGTYTGKFYLK